MPETFTIEMQMCLCIAISLENLNRSFVTPNENVTHLGRVRKLQNPLELKPMNRLGHPFLPEDQSTQWYNDFPLTVFH